MSAASRSVSCALPGPQLHVSLGILLRVVSQSSGDTEINEGVGKFMHDQFFSFYKTTKTFRYFTYVEIYNFWLKVCFSLPSHEQYFLDKVFAVQTLRQI